MGAESGTTSEGRTRIEPSPSPALDTLVFPLWVQLQGANGECWETYYADPIKQDATALKAKDVP